MAQNNVWADRCINGRAFSFRHLRTFDISFEKPAKGPLPALSAIIRVVFDCHVVTEKSTIVATGPAYWLDRGGHCRKFAESRYLRSLELPTIVMALVADAIPCYRAKYNNYMVWKPPADGDGDSPYLLFFDLYRSPHEGRLLILYLQSAYLKDSPGGMRREQRKAFARLCAELLGVIPAKAKGPSSKSVKAAKS